MDELSGTAEVTLQLLQQEFACELGNHAIHSEHVRFATTQEAMMAMLRRAYLLGREEASARPQTFEEAVADVEVANAAARRAGGIRASSDDITK